MLLSFTKQIHVYFFHHLNVMADDDFLLSYQHQDFAVLVQAEVAAATQAQEFGAKAAAAFAKTASVAAPSAAVAAPWHLNALQARRGGSALPPEPVGPPKQLPSALNKAGPPAASNAGQQLPVAGAPAALGGHHLPKGGPSHSAFRALSVLQGSLPENMAVPMRPPPKAQPVAAPAAGPAPKLNRMPETVPKKRSAEEPVETDLQYFKRRLHNSQRSGRNRLYYQVLNMYGSDAAAKYWVEPPQGKGGSSSSAAKPPPP